MLVPTSVQPSSASASLSLVSKLRAKVESLNFLVELMAQTVARYPKQQISELTSRMFLQEWEELMERYGEKPFKDALARVIRDRSREPFFPEPYAIEAECQASAKAEREARRTRRELAVIEDAKAAWQRDYVEDIANGIKRGPSAKAEIDEILSGKQLKVLPEAGEVTPAPLRPPPPRLIDLTESVNRTEEMKARMRKLDPDLKAKEANLGKLIAGSGRTDNPAGRATNPSQEESSNPEPKET